eukprot:510313-Pelagomonas_calceolata.AAC.1
MDQPQADQPNSLAEGLPVMLKSNNETCKLRRVLKVDLNILSLPFGHNVRAPARLPRHVHLDLSQHVMRNVLQLQIMLSRLNVYARKQHLIINTVKSE